jgi:hypothetical protein
MQTLKTEKDNNLLVLGGHRYYKDKSIDEKVIWKCVYFSKFKCRARIHTIGATVVKTIETHHHGSAPGEIAKIEVINELKRKAKNSTESGHVLVANQSLNISSAVAVELPSVSALKCTIRRSRNLASEIPPAPINLRGFVIPDCFKVSNIGQPFLIYDNLDEENRMMVFGTGEFLSYLEQSSAWFADGTFRTAPKHFAQLFTIHFLKNFKAFPAVFGLLPNKKQETYVKLLEVLKAKIPHLKPTSIMTDFEKASMNAFKLVFPEVQNHGCFFHFQQSFYRKLCELGLKTKYDSGLEFCHKMKMIPALAFVPPMQVLSYFNELIDKVFPFVNDTENCDNPVNTEEAEDQKAVGQLINYFEDTYLGRIIRNNKRRAALFPIDHWNCCEAVENGFSKTNNSVEGWHRSFAELVSSSHPIIYKFLTTLKTEQSKNELMMERTKVFLLEPSQKKPRLCSIVEVYRNIDKMDKISYLKAIALKYNF